MSPPNAGAGDLLKSSDKKNAASFTWITLLTWCSLCLGQINGLTPQFGGKKLKQIFQKKGAYLVSGEMRVFYFAQSEPFSIKRHSYTYIWTFSRNSNL